MFHFLPPYESEPWHLIIPLVGPLALQELKRKIPLVLEKEYLLGGTVAQRLGIQLE